MSLIRPKSYQVLITPLVSKGVYGTVTDVSKDIVLDDFIKDKGISTIKREVDNGDFDFGVFVFDSINLTALNLDGKFSDPDDTRSLFKYSRDKAKITINFFNGITNTPDSSFRGLIDDRASKINFGKNEVKLKILSNDSIINRVKIPAGAITNATLVSSAIKTILQLTDIVAVLNYSASNINVQNDYIIDDGSFFDNKTVKKGLDKLLSVSNSILLVEKDTDNMIVRSRDFTTGDVFNFYGHGDVFGRENILDIKNYNTGLQRAFNTITIGAISKSNAGAIDTFGDNPKTLDFGFITNPITEAVIATDILDNWKIPKTELEILCKTSDVKDLKFFDLASVDYPYRIKPYGDNKLPVYGSSKYGTAVYPYVFGNLKIKDNKAFKVIGIKENPKTLLTMVKLRQTGKDISDGYYSQIGSFYGSAIYGLNVYQPDADRIDPNIKSHYGAAKFGTVHYGNI